MEIFTVSGIWLMIGLFVLGIGLTAVGIFLDLVSHSIFTSSAGITVGLILVVLMGCGLMATTGILVFQHSHEPIIYQEIAAEGSSLERAISVSDDIINTDLYTRAIEWNKNLAEIQTAYNNPKYAISFTGDVDWNTLAPINLS